ncbi:hypothetical protein KIN20_031148 [Parelaphostrongylus tenuis]|uniref:Uncharacterized protein n=1 Tax=Parelaphostrongylus tenuis TaxID=148309 RepID=A0AAD5R583_PARTN|nr:hypothetical protein KIN20_031148 [Parelaphostrongylus tenuis]
MAQWLEVLCPAHEVNGSVSRLWLSKPSIPPGSVNWYQTALRLVWEDTSSELAHRWATSSQCEGQVSIIYACKYVNACVWDSIYVQYVDILMYMSACGAVVSGALRSTQDRWFDPTLMSHQAIHPSWFDRLDSVLV